MIFNTPQDAAKFLGYEAGYKHDKAHPKSYRLSVKATAECLATELRINPEVIPGFVQAYRKGCRVARQQRSNVV